MERQVLTKPQTPSRGGRVQRRAAATPADRRPLAALQQSVGSRAVQRLINSRYIQAKLQVNAPGDAFEQEADRVADTVMRMPAPRADRQPGVSGRTQASSVQRKCKECEDEEKQHQPGAVGTVQRQTQEGLIQRLAEDGGELQASSEAEARIGSLRGGGRPLPDSVRDYFEPRFGRDFGGVRLHTGPEAAAAAESIGALAFTAGQDVAFGAGQYSPETGGGKRLLAHELAHVVQQGGAAPRAAQSNEGEAHTVSPKADAQSGPRVSDVIQRAGDPAAIPPGFNCPTDLTPGRPAGMDILFPTSGFTISPAQTAQLTTFMAAWIAAGGNDDILVHGYASTAGEQGTNWTLSCNRARAVEAELIRLGIPAVRINVVAHGESTDFGAAQAPNQHAVVSSSRSVAPLPVVTGTLTARDNFAGRSTTRFGVGETIDLNFTSTPPRPAADFGGLQWNLVSGGGTLAGAGPTGTATYTAPAVGATVVLELRVAAGATAGRVISTHTITIVPPDGVRMTGVPGTFPHFAGGIAPGTWGAGFHANVFVLPRDVSFQGVLFGEGTVAGVVTPPGSFLSGRSGIVHPVNTFGFAHGGNAATGTPVSPPVDTIASFGGVTPQNVLGVNVCGTSDFLWAIPWEFSVAGGPRTAFTTANHHVTSTFFCAATIEKAGAGPFCRNLDGTVC